MAGLTFRGAAGLPGGGSTMKNFFRAVTISALLLGGAGEALAHDTGHESRAPAQCEVLPGTASRGLRANCLRCVSKTGRRGRRFHFHPDNPRGRRCRPDNGRP